MSSQSDRDFIDDIDNNPLLTGESSFIPVRSNGFDNWSGFWGGILIGICGGALVPHFSWLAGLLIFAGYGMTARTLRGNRNRFIRALCFGFGLTAFAGAAIVAGVIFAPNTTWSLIAIAAERNLIFCGFAIMPWVLGIARYILVRVRA